MWVEREAKSCQSFCWSVSDHINEGVPTDQSPNKTQEGWCSEHWMLHWHVQGLRVFYCTSLGTIQAVLLHHTTQRPQRSQEELPPCLKAHGWARKQDCSWDALTRGFSGYQLSFLLLQSQLAKSISISPKKLLRPRGSLCQTERFNFWISSTIFSILY